jgi:hypothetical protein
MKIVLIIAAVLLGLWILWGWLSVRIIEEPKYDVVSANDIYEVRKYEPIIIAKTTVEGTREAATNEGFKRIADYIFGNNTVNESIAMTTPVTSQNSEKIAMTTPVTSLEDESGTHTITFVMPSKYTIATLPKPVTNFVTIEQVPEKTYAVFKFSGWISDEKVQAKKDFLVSALKTDNVKFNYSHMLSQYNPPWTPWFMRRNEIWIELSE